MSFNAFTAFTVEFESNKSSGCALNSQAHKKLFKENASVKDIFGVLSLLKANLPVVKRDTMYLNCG